VGRSLVAILLVLAAGVASPCALAEAAGARDITAREDLASERRLVFVAIVATLTITLGVAGLFVFRRAKARGAASESRPVVLPEAATPTHAKPPKLPVAPLTKICPACGERYTSNAARCEVDKTVLVLLN
jgi:hypothetical protein